MSTDLEFQHFRHLSKTSLESLFDLEPTTWRSGEPVEALAARLGGTLYIPASRPNLGQDVLRAASAGITSVILDLEDSIATSQQRLAFDHVIDALDVLSQAQASHGPAVFIRLGSPDQADVIVRRATGVPAFCGLVLPKFTPRDISQLAVLAATDRPLYAMPVIETATIVDPTTRRAELDRICNCLEPWRQAIVAVRVGAVDIAAALGVRRPAGASVWDVPVLASILADVAATFTVRGFVVTGSAWDGLGPARRDLSITKRLLGGDHDALMREAELDRANGMCGKTTIHPDQAKVVNALSAVTASEWADASQVLSDPGGGVTGSWTGSRMIEPRPMQQWARKVAIRAEAFGVLRPGRTDRDLLESEVEW